MSQSDFSAYQKAIVGTTLEPFAARGFYFPVRENVIAETMPTKVRPADGEWSGKMRYAPEGVSTLVGVGKSREIPHEVLVLATRVNIADLPQPATGRQGSIDGFAKLLSAEFAHAGLVATRRESGEDVGKTALIAVQLPLTPEAYAAAHGIAQKLRGPANQQLAA